MRAAIIDAIRSITSYIAITREIRNEYQTLKALGQA
jgi:hypothetical protein